MPTKPKPKGGQTVEVRLIRRHPGQMVVHGSPARFKTVMCGRRWGKTAYGIREVCDAALAGQPVGWFAPTYKYVLEVWRELLERLRPVVVRSHDQDKRIELATGGVIEIWTMDGENPGLGRKYALAVIDEAGIVPDLLTIWQQALRPTLVDLRGRALFLGTPRGRRHGFVQLFNRGMSGEDADWASFRARTLDNPYIPPEEVEQARRELPAEVFAQEFEGIPTDDGANPFGLEAIARAVQPSPCGKDAPLPVVYGLDLARSMDYTVLLGLDAWRRVVRIDRWQAPWAITKVKVRQMVGETPVVADATGVGDAIVADLQALGVSVTPHVFTQPSKLRLMQRLVAAFQGAELTIPAGEAAHWLVQELNAFEFLYTATGVRYEAPRGEHDDGVMALGLALYGWDRVQGAVPEAPAPVVALGDDPQIARERSRAEAGGALIGGIWTPDAPELPP
ncbi:MAG: hypothetical protein KJT01_16960, partial [Gemmatimonadetes bacterium]|nr:hypothetical protein [Gemmatimonadota bacterium]